MMARIGKRQLSVFGLTAAMTMLGGCSIFHENVKGGFTCQAPRGVCAPSSTIDDAALAQIGGNHGGDLLPANFDATAMQDPAPSKHGRRHRADPVVAMVSGARVSVGRPALRVVHPAWVDAQGRRHERTTEYAYVDAAPALAYDPPAIGEGAVDAGGDRSLLGVAVRAPDAGSPVAALSPVSSGTDPNAVIRAKVNAILARAPKPMVMVPTAAPASVVAPQVVASHVAAPPVASSEAAASAGSAQSAGVFPPAGS